MHLHIPIPRLHVYQQYQGPVLRKVDGVSWFYT